MAKKHSEAQRTPDPGTADVVARVAEQRARRKAGSPAIQPDAVHQSILDRAKLRAASAKAKNAARDAAAVQATKSTGA